MCRHLAYLGPYIALRTLLFDAPHALVDQARAPRLQTSGKDNPDGWGVAWWTADAVEPRRYRTTTAMWEDTAFTDGDEKAVAIVKLAGAHPKIFGSLVTIGELTIGLSLLLGVLTRVSAALGALMLFSFAAGAGQGLAPPGNALLMGVLCLLFVAAPPGRFLSVDVVLRARLPRWMV